MTRRAAVFAVIVALLIGLAVGFVLRGAVSSDGTGFSLQMVQSDSGDAGNGSSTALLTAAADTLDALNSRDVSALSSLADPDEGVTFTPYSTVDFSTDVTLTAKDLKKAESESTSYVWGVTLGDREPMKMTVTEFLSEFLWDADYTACPSFGVDTVLYTGNAQENVAEAYPDCRFVDCYLPGQGGGRQPGLVGAETGVCLEGRRLVSAGDHPQPGHGLNQFESIGGTPCPVPTAAGAANPPR